MKYVLLVLLTVLSLSASAQEEEEKDKSTGACGGVERWDVKVLADAAANTVNFIPGTTTITGLATLPTPVPSTTMPRYAGVEDKTYKVTCNITIKKTEDDSDYHLVLSDGTYTLIGEVPDPFCSIAAGSSHVNEYLQARQFVDANIAAGNVNVSLPPVVVTGVAFIDPPHGQTGKAPNNIELHPILNIHFVSAGIDNMVGGVSFSISPNPFTDRLMVTMDKAMNHGYMYLYNLTGIRVFEAPIGAKTEVVSLPYLPSGTYLYRVINEGRSVSQGLIIRQ